MTAGIAGPLVLVGAGKMGGAMLAGWLRAGLSPATVWVVEPVAAARAEAAALGVNAVADAAELPAALRPVMVVVAVKPQGFDAVLPAYARFANACFLSVAAGKTLARMAQLLGGAVSAVRSIPNTPAAVGRGITAAVANAHVAPAQKAMCTTLLDVVGETVWVADEALIDPITAVSGSGPAYVFLLIEALAAAGVDAGLEPALAQRLARATVCGAGELAWRSDLPASELRRNVTSPNGTTQAALDVLMAADGLGPLLAKAVAAASRRSRELAN